MLAPLIYWLVLNPFAGDQAWGFKARLAGSLSVHAFPPPTKIKSGWAVQRAQNSSLSTSAMTLSRRSILKSLYNNKAVIVS